MSQKLTTAIHRAYVDAARLHAMYDERYQATKDQDALERRARQTLVIDTLLPILEALPWAARQAIFTTARDEVAAVRETTRDELQRLPSWRMG